MFAVGDLGNKTSQQTRCDGEGLSCPSCVDSSHVGSTKDEDCCLSHRGPKPLVVSDFVEILIAELRACITRGP